MKKLTLILDAKAVTRARKQATLRKVSLSRFVSELVHQHWRESQRRLREERKRNHEYQDAMNHWLAQKPFAMKGPAERYLTREEIYDRSVLRRL
jgi:Family of unknown function (DUF6364)